MVARINADYRGYRVGYSSASLEWVLSQFQIGGQVADSKNSSEPLFVSTFEKGWFSGACAPSSLTRPAHRGHVIGRARPPLTGTFARRRRPPRCASGVSAPERP